MSIRSGELVIILGVNRKNVVHYFKSLQFHMVLLFALFVFASSVLIKGTVLDSYQERTVAMRTAEIQSQCNILSNQLISSNYLEHTESEIVNAELSQLSNIYNGRVIVVNDEFCIIKDTYNLQEGKTIIAEDVVKCFRGEQTTRYDEENAYIEVGTPIRVSMEEPVRGMMLVSVSANSIQNEVTLLETKLEVAITTVMIVTIIAAILVSMFLMYPFKRISRKIGEIADGYGDNSLRVDNYVETTAISDAFNRMQERYRVLDESRDEFVSNVSHELKTPLTSMKILADSLLMQPDTPIELYQEFMGDLSEEIERENKIINDLLSLVKLDKTGINLNVQTENVNEVVERILKRLRPLAVKHNTELVFESFRMVMAEVDEMKLGLILTNLVENAIKYNHEGGWVRVELNADHKDFYLRVSDSGMGIPKEDIDHIFERFYRVDKSHSRGIGGTGLGLTIARNAVIMHRGTIKVQSILGEGTTFIVRIPLTYIAKQKEATK